LKNTSAADVAPSSNVVGRKGDKIFLVGTIEPEVQFLFLSLRQQ
jgi:hypothetical protein